MTQYLCSECGKHYMDHDARQCDMRYVHADELLEYLWVTKQDFADFEGMMLLREVVNK